MTKILNLIKILILCVMMSGATAHAQNDWLVYWYICGSNLESDNAAATADLQELINSNIEGNVKVLIQAGGSNQWHNSIINSEAVNRWLFDGENLSEIETLADADMGDAATLEDFLNFGKNNFTAEHKVLVLWNHGGGSVGGVCQDERTGNTLSLNEVHNAIESVYGSSIENPPFEVIGFDACLMATYETAGALQGLSKYMVASEDIEPGCGWDYTRWIHGLSNNTSMNGAELGKIICDSYMAGCMEYGVEDSATLSVIDLSMMNQLKSNYENYGIEALRAAANNPQNFFSMLSRSANEVGAITNDFNLTDLRLLTARTQNLIKSSQALGDAVEKAVIYNVQGKYRNGGGLSTFYPYNSNGIEIYEQIESAPLVSKSLYHYQIYGTMPKEGKSFLESDSVDLEAHYNLNELEGAKVQLDRDNNAYVELTSEQVDMLSGVNCLLAYIDVEDDLILFLGSDSNVKVDWETGIFSDNFTGTWPMLNGHAVYVELIQSNSDYNLYFVPIKLNGVRCNIEIVYDFAASEYKILGARRVSEQVADRNLISLKPGDEITTVHYAMTISGDEEDFSEVEAETFTLEENAHIEDQLLGNGEYGYLFEFVAPNNDNALSNLVHFTVNDGEIFTELVED